MRWLLVLALVGCGSSADSSCPAELADGDPCGFTGRCFHEDTFSSCASSWCTCSGGTTTCTPINPTNGVACGDEPIDHCEYEGNPSCDTLPTSEACGCTADGVWSCGCYCYGARTTCSVDPCDVLPERLAGAFCSDAGTACTYPGNVTCACEAQGSGPAMYRCF